MKIKKITIFLMLAAALALLPAFFVSAETSVAQVTVYSTPAPTGLAVVQVSTSSVLLFWDDVAGASAYRIYVDDVLAGQVSTTTYLASALSPSTLYSFRVSSLDSGSIESALSGAVSTTTEALPYVPPVTPTTTTPVSGGFVPALGQKIPPAVGIITSFKITYNGVATSAPSKQVILSIKAPGATHMQASNDPTFKNSQWTKFSPELVWQLSEGLGNKVIYLRLQSQKEAIKTIFVEARDELRSENNSNTLNYLIEALKRRFMAISSVSGLGAPEKALDIDQDYLQNSKGVLKSNVDVDRANIIAGDKRLDSSNHDKSEKSIVPVSPKTATISVLVVIAILIAITVIF